MMPLPLLFFRLERKNYSSGTRLFLLAGCVLAAAVSSSRAYVEAPMSLGALIHQSSHIVLMRVEKVDKEKNLIIFRKMRDLKGKHPHEVVKHNIGRGGFHPREWQFIMAWAEVGKTAVFMHNGGGSETCIDDYWYQAHAGGEWWTMSHAEPFLLRSFAGKPDKLAGIVQDVLAGKEVVVPCMADGNKDDLHLRRAKRQRLRVSLKLQDYNAQRDFAGGGGGDDFEGPTGMAGFTHRAVLPRVDPEAQALASLDIDGDGKTDLCLIGAGKIVLLRNGGASLDEIALPGGAPGSRAAVWADYNHDGKPDLLLASLTGPKLFTNLGGSFRDDSALLPREPCYNLTAAAWIDFDSDGKPDLLLGNGFHGLRLYRNRGMAEMKPLGFEDISIKVGLGPDGIGNTVKGDTLTVADVNHDGRPDFLYGAGTGMLVLNTLEGFVEAKDSGIVFKAGKVGPIFGDFHGDGRLDLFVPQQQGPCKLFRNDGKGQFTDMTAKAGDLAQPLGLATSAACGDFYNDGRLHLAVGCLRGPNRIFRNLGGGRFKEETEALGLHQRVFNTQAVGMADLNNDGVLDLIFNNEGQDSVAMLSNKALAAPRTPVTFQVSGADGVIGSRVKVLDKDGNLQGSVRYLSGGEGRGGQQPLQAHFALQPGSYRIEVRYSSGVTRVKEITVAQTPLRGVIDDLTPKVK